MVNRSDISRRSRAKTLKRVQEERRSNPEKYSHDVTEKSRFLTMDYDYKRGLLSEFKLPEYERLKKLYGEEQ